MSLRVLSGREKVLELDAVELADIFFAVAGDHKREGDIEKSRTLYERALSIYKMLYGDDHEDVQATIGVIESLDQETVIKGGE